jgi:hypothetical protein
MFKKVAFATAFLGMIGVGQALAVGGKPPIYCHITDEGKMRCCEKLDDGSMGNCFDVNPSDPKLKM